MNGQRDVEIPTGVLSIEVFGCSSPTPRIFRGEYAGEIYERMLKCANAVDEFPVLDLNQKRKFG